MVGKVPKNGIHFEDEMYIYIHSLTHLIYSLTLTKIVMQSKESAKEWGSLWGWYIFSQCHYSLTLMQSKAMADKREVWLQVASASSSKHFHITSLEILKTGDMYCSVDIWFRRFLSAATEETQRGAADKSDQICLNWYKTELNCCCGGGWHERGWGW